MSMDYFLISLVTFDTCNEPLGCIITMHIQAENCYVFKVISNCDITPTTMIWVKVFKNEPRKVCGRQLLKKLTQYSLLRQTMSLQIF